MLDIKLRFVSGYRDASKENFTLSLQRFPNEILSVGGIYCRDLKSPVTHLQWPAINFGSLFL